jgi:hypothetical protein
MKRIAYSFLLIFGMSCGSHFASSDNRIRVEMRDSTVQDFYLLSLRSDALVVSPYIDKDISADSLVAHARLVSFARTETISYQPEISVSILSGLGGCILGTVAGCLAGGYAMKQEGDISTLFGYGALGGAIGFGGGMLIAIGLRSPPDDHVIYDIKNHVEELYSRAIYPGQEPPELQKIK